jgi:hypothetical protein
MDLDNMMLSFKGIRQDGAGNRQAVSKAELVEKTADPVFSHTQPLTPLTFNMQYPQPLDPLEVMDLCEEISAVRSIPIEDTGLKNEQWMETTNLYMDAGQYMFFADGECPEEYTETGTYHTTYLKNYGVKKSLTVMDIKHSASVLAAADGIRALLGGYAAGEREPGGYNLTTFVREGIADIKAKEIRKGMTLALNGLDWTLIRGNSATDPLEFDGLETQIANCSDEHTNTSCPTGTFSADDFDRFISEGCAKPTHVWGHPLALQNVAAQYFQLGWQGSQLVGYTPSLVGAERITPGYGFANAINTQVGRLPLVGDANFNRTAIAGDCGGLFRSIVYPLRMIHNGEPLIYRPRQFPLGYQDLTPGCTAVSFQIWGREALTIKACCAQGAYTAQFNGNIATTCTRIGSLGPGRTGGAPTLT